MGFFRRLFGGAKHPKQMSGEQPRVFARLAGPGSFQFDIVGESFRQGTLGRICGGRCHDGHRKEVEAVLVHEDGNPKDNMALAVLIGEELVGYLDRKGARQFRARMREAGAAGVPALCAAMIVGGWDRGRGNTGHFGVKLDLPVE